MYGEAASGTEVYPTWDVGHFVAKLSELHEEQILDALEILEHQGCLEITRVVGGAPRGIGIMQPTLPGFLMYVNTFVPSIADDIRRAALSILNERARSNSDVESVTGLTPFVAHQILSHFESRNWIQLTHTMDGTYIVGVSPLLKREFE